MTGGFLAYGPCFACGELFGFNPERVPSIPIDPASGEPDAGGVRRPICRACVEAVNPGRVQLGLEPIVIFDDSYQPSETLG